MLRETNLSPPSHRAVLALAAAPLPRLPPAPAALSPAPPAMGLLTSAELNYLVFRYLQESGTRAIPSPRFRLASCPLVPREL
jgi:transducin (beta)-like 1